jgi:hypothetical protein
VPGPFAAEAGARHAAQLVVDERKQPLKGARITLLPGVKQSRDVVVRLRIRHFRDGEE